MGEPTFRKTSREVRQERYGRGITSELIAAAYLVAKGYRILGRRVKTSQGEIDLIVRRGKRLSFVEVKARPTFADAEAALYPEQRERIFRAADVWLQRRPRLASLDRTFDAVFIVPWSWPRHHVNVL